MAAWLFPALKAVLPHVGTIISAAAPVFTKRRDDAAANQAVLLQEQIGELQAAAAQNATHIRELAAQLQATLSALEQAAAMAEKRMRRLVLLCGVALLFSVAALGVTLMLLSAH